jgi:hypothetical protein
MIAGDQVERGARFRLVLVVPARIIPAATSLDLFRGQAEQGKVSSPAEAMTDGAIRIHPIGVDTLRSRDVLALVPASLEPTTIVPDAFRL